MTTRALPSGEQTLSHSERYGIYIPGFPLLYFSTLIFEFFILLYSSLRPHTSFTMAVISTLTLTNNPALRDLEAVLLDPFLRSIFYGAVGSTMLDFKPSRLDINTHLNFGVTSYSLDPAVASALWLGLKKLAQIIHCAGNDYNPFTTLQPLPITIPTEKLCSAGLSPPLISLILAFPFTNALLARCDSVEEVYRRIDIVRHIANYYV